MILALVVSVSASSIATAQQAAPHVAAGEFGLALEAVRGAPANVRDPILAQVASTQGSLGNPVAAAQAAQAIQSPSERMGAMQGARGGGAFADFDSLMQLIQTTVVPDTWEALGGPSTMAPYPQGVYVDTDGTLRPCESFSSDDAAANLRSLLSRGAAGNNAVVDNAAWRRPSPLRCVSLRRLRDELTHRSILAADTDVAMLHMAGLSEIKYVFLSENDIVLAGPVGGIETTKGWHRDRQSGLSTLRSDFLLTCIASAMANQPFGCTIDPTPEGMQRAAAVSTGIQANRIPIGKAAEQMSKALGMQRVEVFGTAGDTPVGYLMVEADRHMKQLALGQEPMPDGVKNYLDIIDDSIARGPPNEMLLRLWFTASQRSVRADADRSVFEIGGDAIQLSGENQRALANGQRGQVAMDPRTDAFVGQFNRHWTAIRTKYPLYGALESIYRAASIAAVLDRHAVSPQHQAILQALTQHASSSQWLMPSPRQVESIAVLHKVRHGRTIHNVVVASGGVLVSTRESVQPKLIDYPALASVRKPAASQPRVIQRWWWDANDN